MQFRRKPDDLIFGATVYHEERREDGTRNLVELTGANEEIPAAAKGQDRVTSHSLEMKVLPGEYVVHVWLQSASENLRRRDEDGNLLPPEPVTYRRTRFTATVRP